MGQSVFVFLLISSLQSYKMLFAIILVTVLSTAPCGNDCVVNTDCTRQADTPCNTCINEVCKSGCGKACIESSDCGYSDCSSCNMTTQLCVPASGYKGCGEECEVNNECKSSCSQCIKNDPMLPGTCGDGCGMKCTLNAHCTNSNCSRCDNTTLTCQPNGTVPTPPPGNGTCGSACVVNTQCEGECFQCIKNNPNLPGTCGDGCGMNCTEDVHCANTKCPICDSNDKFCVSIPSPPVSPTPGPGRCGDACEVDAHCGDRYCNQCIKINGNGVCGVTCGMNCTMDSQCKNPVCASCDKSSNTCEVPLPPTPHEQCGDTCAVDLDCTGFCALCMNHKCAQGCSAPCRLDSDCGDANCKHCNSKRRCAASP